MWLVLMGVYLVGLLIFLSRSKRKSEDAVNATICLCDMIAKAREMTDDPQTTWEDWRDFLPVAQWADNWWHRTHPQSIPMNLTKDVVMYMHNCN